MGAGHAGRATADDADALRHARPSVGRPPAATAVGRRRCSGPNCSVTNRFSARIAIGRSIAPRRQASSHGAAHTRPHTEANGFGRRAVRYASLVVAVGDRGDVHPGVGVHRARSQARDVGVVVLQLVGQRFEPIRCASPDGRTRAPTDPAPSAASHRPTAMRSCAGAAGDPGRSRSRGPGRGRSSWPRSIPTTITPVLSQASSHGIVAAVVGGDDARAEHAARSRRRRSANATTHCVSSASSGSSVPATGPVVDLGGRRRTARRSRTGCRR